MINTRWERAAKGSQLDLIVVTRVQKGDAAPLIEPLFERGGREFRRRAPGGIDPIHTEGDDFFFDPHEHSREGLVVAFAGFNGKALQSRNAPQLR